MAEFICVQITDRETEETREVRVPAEYEVCGRCRGKGKHSHAIGAITADEWNSPDWSEEEKEDYLNGKYDQQCEVCKGLRVILVPVEERCVTDDQKAGLQSLKDDAEYEAECAAERRQLDRMAGHY